jgi:type VI secretion system secreted protein VgrG
MAPARLQRHRDLIVARRRAGATLLDIAADLDCSESALSYRLKAWGVAVPPVRRRRDPAIVKRDAEIARLARTGIAPAILAERFGLKQNHVSVILWKARRSPMTASRTPRDAFAHAVAVWEGAYQAYPEDVGNWITDQSGARRLIGTNRGVTPAALAAFRGVPAYTITVAMMRALTIEDAVEIGMRLYYYGPGFDALAWAPPTEVWVDIGWGSGPRTAIRALQRLAGADPDGVLGPETIARYSAWLGGADAAERCERVAVWRRAFYRRIVAKHPKQEKFLKGWLNRAEHYTAANPAWWRLWHAEPGANGQAKTPAED